MPALLLLALLLSGCTGMLIDRLNERHVQSCVWFSNPISGARSITATGGLDIATCLSAPCQGR
jgi:hypothetical protein